MLFQYKYGITLQIYAEKTKKRVIFEKRIRIS
jgi:hypothetical protein